MPSAYQLEAGGRFHPPTGSRERTCEAPRKTDMLLTFVACRERRTGVPIITRVRAASVALTAATISAAAQLSPQWQFCTGNPGIDWDTQIKSCTALIQSGTEAKENMAIAFYNRAVAHENKEKYDLAIADYSEAIRLNPNDADFYLYRGLDRQKIGDKAGAEADIAEAKRLNPNIGK
jgi:tetratricopeptide (TPR) repeat protein